MAGVEEALGWERRRRRGGNGEASVGGESGVMSQFSESMRQLS